MGIPSWYVTSQSRYLSLLSSTGPEMSASQGAVAVLCGREGNRRSGIALARHHRVYPSTGSMA